MNKKFSYLGLLLSTSLTLTANSKPICDIASPLEKEKTCAAQESLSSPPLATSTEPNTPFQPFTGKVKGNRVRLRLQPTLEAQVLRESKAGELFAIVAENQSFYAIRAPKDMKGYVFRTFVLDNVVEGERVNIRLAPDLESPVIGQLHRGDSIVAGVAAENNKWLEIALPSSLTFYIAKDYVIKAGEITLADEMEAKRSEALHRLSAAFCFAEASLQKPFEEIEFPALHEKFTTFISDFNHFPDLVEKAREADQIIEDAYVQKKIAFLDAKSDHSIALLEESDMKRLTAMAVELKGALPVHMRAQVSDSREAGTGAYLATGTFASGVITDKMAAWQAIEESLYHNWAAQHQGKSMEDYYSESLENTAMLSGIVECYDRPVKNRPGDFLLSCDGLPVAFIYSTKINLQALVGQKVTVIAAPRPNNHFAFPAYFVLGVE